MLSCCFNFKPFFFTKWNLLLVCIAAIIMLVRADNPSYPSYPAAAVPPSAGASSYLPYPIVPSAVNDNKNHYQVVPLPANTGGYAQPPVMPSGKYPSHPSIGGGYVVQQPNSGSGGASARSSSNYGTALPVPAQIVPTTMVCPPPPSPCIPSEGIYNNNQPSPPSSVPTVNLNSQHFHSANGVNRRWSSSMTTSMPAPIIVAVIISSAVLLFSLGPLPS